MAEHLRQWCVVPEKTHETATGIIVLGRRDEQPVALKLIDPRSDEKRLADVLSLFDGVGMVRLYERAEDAVLMERPEPGTQLVQHVFEDRDEAATAILADVIARMSPAAPTSDMPTVQDWSTAFDRYADSGDTQIPGDLVEGAARLYRRLCFSQSQPRLLHGDLHHYNVLFDAHRGWLAIDPKGVVGEIEYEVGATLRNPFERPELFTQAAVIERRLRRFATALHLDLERALGWSFAQAVLSSIWTVEDGGILEPSPPTLDLARAMRVMLDGTA